MRTLLGFVTAAGGVTADAVLAVSVVFSAVIFVAATTEFACCAPR
jgi:hypothetical protein